MQGPRARLVFDNIGAEENVDANNTAPPLVRLRRAFREVITSRPWPFLDVDAVFAWYNSPEAFAYANAERRPLFGAPPDVTRQVHDKAFAVRAQQHNQTFAAEVIDVVDDNNVNAAVHRLALPSGTRITLKPRFGTSGRGRLMGHVVDAGVQWDSPTARGFARLNLRGGAVCEPWVTRIEDLSSLWFVDGGPPQLLGTSRLLVSDAGLYQGTALIRTDDDKARYRSGSRHESALLSISEPLVASAHAAGYRGMLGVDVMVFVDATGTTQLRACEINARFTAAHVAIGLAHTSDAGAVKFSLDSDNVLTPLS